MSNKLTKETLSVQDDRLFLPVSALCVVFPCQKLLCIHQTNENSRESCVKVN